MDFTLEIAKSYSISPFDVMKQDKDEVIMLLNYFIEKSEATEIKHIINKPLKNDGFWDM